MLVLLLKNSHGIIKVSILPLLVNLLHVVCVLLTHEFCFETVFIFKTL